MRNPERIPKLLKIVEKIWTENPDLRLCQLIGNCWPAGDLYHKEDFELEKKLIEKYNIKEDPD